MAFVMRWLALLGLLVITACSGAGDDQTRADSPARPKADWLQADWAAIESAARGTKVNFAMSGGPDHADRWVDEYVVREMEERFDITVIRVPMDAGMTVYQLLAEKAAGRDLGTIDLVWISGVGFRALKQAGALYGPYASKCPNFVRYVDPVLASMDFGQATEGYETPCGQSQLVFEFDQSRVAPPRSFAELAEWVREHPGRFTYPQPSDLTGSAFIRQALCAVTGGPDQYRDGFYQVLFDRNAPPLWAYLNGLEPYLWQEGRTYPRNLAAQEALFASGEIDLSMSRQPLHAQSRVLDGSYPASVRTFVMEEGSLFNLHFTTIPFNAPNVAGAMVLADFLLSPEAQLSKFDPENWGDFPAIDLSRLRPEMKERFAEVNLGAPTISTAQLGLAAVPEIPAEYVEALERGWRANVLGE